MTFPLSIQAPGSFFYPYSSTVWILKPIYILEAWGLVTLKMKGSEILDIFLEQGYVK